jgi:hypothetical protein
MRLLNQIDESCLEKFVDLHPNRWGLSGMNSAFFLLEGGCIRLCFNMMFDDEGVQSRNFKA